MALYIPGTTEQDQLMVFLVKKFSLDDKDQAYVRKLMRGIEEGSIQNYVDKIKPELQEKVIRKKQEQISNAQEFDREQELIWLSKQR